MKVLIVGGGGREHALAWKLSQSPKVTEVLVAPGNAGSALVARNAPVSAEDVDGLLALAQKEGVGLTVVGPEAPLVLGIVDRFREAGLKIFGPTKAAAQLEGSKSFSKRMMEKFGVPTAAYGEFTRPEDAKAFIREKGAPIVVKADGLAAGKGVVVARTVEEALEAIDRIMVAREFESAGDLVVVEEFLEGEEASFLAFCDGKHVVPMASSQDHKAVFDGDTGPNTGGMGAYSPAPVVTDAIHAEVMRCVMQAMVDGMAREGIPYSGILYAGLMIKDGKAKVLEFNCRFGDPECQPIVMRMRGDLLDVLLAAIDGRLDRVALEWDPRAAVCVVLASEGYPGNYPKGVPIDGLAEAEKAPDVAVFHAGTRLDGGRVVTTGGRVLGVTGLGTGVAEAIAAAYAGVAKISWPGMHYRTDIGKKALAKG